MCVNVRVCVCVCVCVCVYVCMCVCVYVPASMLHVHKEELITPTPPHQLIVFPQFLYFFLLFFFILPLSQPPCPLDFVQLEGELVDLTALHEALRESYTSSESARVQGIGNLRALQDVLAKERLARVGAEEMGRKARSMLEELDSSTRGLMEEVRRREAEATSQQAAIDELSSELSHMRVLKVQWASDLQTSNNQCRALSDQLSSEKKETERLNTEVHRLSRQLENAVIER